MCKMDNPIQYISTYSPHSSFLSKYEHGLLAITHSSFEAHPISSHFRPNSENKIVCEGGTQTIHQDRNEESQIIKICGF